MNALNDFLSNRHVHLFAYVVFVSLLLVGIYRVETFAHDTRRNLCRFVDNLEDRRDAQQDYLEDVEAGRRQIIPGLNPADLQRSIDSQTATLMSFRDLHCE